MWWNDLLEFLKESIIVDVAGILGVILSSINLVVTWLQRKNLKEADHKQEEKILYLTKLYENLPNLKEQREKKCAAISKYKDVVSAIIKGENKMDIFESVADEALTSLDEVLDADLISEIDALNKKIKEYFERLRNNDFYANVTLGEIGDLFENLKPKLLSCIREQKNTEAYTTEYLQVAREGKEVEKSSMGAKKTQCLRNKVIKHNKETKPPRKRRG